jgi:hypothetical protein
MRVVGMIREDLTLAAFPYQLSYPYRHADLRFPCLADSRSGTVMCCRPPVSRAGCQGGAPAAQRGRTTLTAGHRCDLHHDTPGDPEDPQASSNWLGRFNRPSREREKRE